jgi:predicted membrane protein
METNIINPNKPTNGKTMAGIIIVIIGGLLLINQLDMFFIPHWLFSWPMWIIAYGVYMGGKYKFRKPIWAVMIFIGVAFLFTENVDNAERIVWPVAIIATGLYLVVKHNKQVTAQNQDNHYTQV